MGGLATILPPGFSRDASALGHLLVGSTCRGRAPRAIDFGAGVGHSRLLMRSPAGSALLLFLLAAGTASRLSAAASAQDPPDSLDINGTWRFDTEETVRVTHEGSSVRAEFLDGAECMNGEMRPYFLDGVLSGTSLTGNMMVCSRSPRLIEECGISSMYETTFEATVEPGRISGTRVAQGLATEEEDGRYVSCTPDSRYDGSYDFAGRSCSHAERELAELNDQLDAMVTEMNAIADQLAATVRSGNWLDESYSGPNADLAARYRELEREIAEVMEQRSATQDPAEIGTLDSRIDTLVAELNEIGDVLSFMNVTDWTKDDFIGPDAELAAHWRQLNVDAVELLPRINEAMARAAECAREECPSPAEGQELLARLEAMSEEWNGIAEQLHAMPKPPWFDEEYTGPNADQAARAREIGREMLELDVRMEATEDPVEITDLHHQMEALAAEGLALEDVLYAMNVTNWTRDDYIGPGAELAARAHALDVEILDVVGQLNEVEERRRECAEGVG